MTNWKLVTLADLGDLSRGKSKHRPRNDASLYGGNYPFIQTGDVKQANFYINDYSQTYNEKGLKQSKLWEKDTLCITIAANIAESALLSFSACFPDSIVGFIPFERKSDVRFIKYLLDNYKSEFQKRSKGATQDNLSVEKINSLKVKVPEYEYQVKVAETISKYDELIGNNQKRIAILEEMAQRLYTEWFVKFNFPHHENVKMVDSGTEFGEIPEGWEIKNLENISDILFGFTFKSKQFKEEPVGNKVVRIRDILSGDTATYSEEAVDEKFLIKYSDLLIGMDGIFHMNIWFTDSCYLNQRVSRIRSKLPSLYLKFAIKNQLDLLQKVIKGSTVGHLSNGDIRSFRVIVPANKGFLDFFKSNLDEIGNLYLQNKKLIMMRDLLIENLVTGKRLLKQNGKTN